MSRRTCASSARWPSYESRSTSTISSRPAAAPRCSRERIVNGDIRYAFARADCPRTGDPEATARAELATLFPALWLKKTLVRLTSWRYEDERIVLTFVGYSDEFDPDKLHLVMPLTVLDTGSDATSRIAAQAVRHLAFLVQHDGASVLRSLRPETRAWLIDVAPASGGRLDLKGAAA